mgnify:CR=1 FL=1
MGLLDPVPEQLTLALPLGQEELTRFPGLHDLLRSHYRHAVRIEDLDIYLRSGSD